MLSSTHETNGSNMTALAHARRLAAATPHTRNRYVDLLRAVSIIAVVLGHWLIAAPYIANGEIDGINLLAHSPWTQWLTWLFQVMPVFFMVGGYSNAVSWNAANARGHDYGTWLTARLRRLLVPTAALVTTWAVLGMSLTAAGIDPAILRMGSQSAIIPVWFLAVYVVVVAATPLLTSAWDRWGWASITSLAAAALAVDLASTTHEWLGWLNFAFVWAGITQLGIAWRRGRIGGRSALPLAALTGALLIVLVGLGAYPISMVGVPGAVATNNAPPTFALMMFGLAQTSALLAIEPVAHQILERARVWTATVLVNGIIMTLYLWHLTAMVLLIGASMLMGGVGFRIVPGTGFWWITRPIWLVVASLATVPFLLMFRRFDSMKPMPDGIRIKPIVALSVTVAGCAGMALLAAGGITGSFFGINAAAVALALGAAGALRRGGPTRFRPARVGASAGKARTTR